MNIGLKIKELREQKGLTVNKLATLSGISQSYLRDIELGNKQPTIEYIEYICYGLDITLEKFFADNKTNEELLNLIYSLSPEEKEKLTSFLKEITKKR